MVLTRYGLDIAVPILLVSAIIVVAGILFPVHPLLRGAIIAAGLTLFLFTAFFFRDPERHVPDDPRAVLAPADGTVISIDEVDEPEYIGGRAVQVSIFMSPFNVHVNRFPVGGRVEYVRHIPGKFLVAFADKASDMNERTLIGVSHGGTRVFFKQIAGLVARRIVCPLKAGDSAVAGRRFGMIRFGSRVDVFLPAGVPVGVAVRQRVTAGETVLALLPDAPHPEAGR